MEAVMDRHWTRRSTSGHVLGSPSHSFEVVSLTNIDPPSLKNVKKPAPLQERTNSTDTQQGNGLIMGKRTNVIRSSTLASIIPADQRRMKRYSLAEEQLARQLEKCRTETSPLELQIRTLKEATSILSAHAEDARERAEKLRGLLVNKDMEPEAYESLKRERWLQEHRQGAVDQERNAVQQQLALLDSPSPQGTNPQTNREITREERRRRNLLSFLKASSQLPSVRIRKATSVLVERPQKRRTMDRVSPMRLRTTPTSSRSSLQPLRPMSLDGWTRRSRPTSTPAVPIPVFALPASLQLVSEGDSDDAISQPTETASSYVSTFTAESTLSTPPTTAATLPPSQPPSTGLKPKNESGTATIYLDTRLVEAQYVPEDIDVPLPDYAMDLFSRFDYNFDIGISTSNTLVSRPCPLRSSGVGPRQPASSQTKSIPTSSRQASSFLEIPSFASPKQQDEDINATCLGRKPSQRNLGGLFSIPEALSSRIKVDSGERKARTRASSPSNLTSKSSLALTAVPDETKVDLSTKIKKRFSILRLGRS